jgi:Flp pilus assembly protein protease CpaA
MSEHQVSAAAMVVLSVVLLSAVLHDVRERKIPNRVCVVLLIVGLTAQALLEGVVGLALGAAGAIVGLVLFLPMYARGAMGAGDVKLLASCCTFVGPAGAVFAAGATLLAGGALAVGFLAKRTLGEAWTTRSFYGAAAALTTARRERFPYAGAIAIGVLASVWHRDLIDQFTMGVLR